jgi:hypothetical protein
VFFLLLLCNPWRTTMVASDGDAFMHWRVGEWMLAHKRIIRFDEFSHTRSGAPIISKEWLSELIFAIAGRWAGLFGIAAVGAIVIATTFASLHRQLLREGNDLLAATAIVFLAAAASSTHWLARPHAFSFLLVVLWNDALRRFDRTVNTRRLLLWLVPLMILWVNLHGAFLAGFLVLAAYWIAAALNRDREKSRALTLTGLLCAGASLLNPNGYKLHVHNIEFLRSDFFKNWLAEYASMRFDSPDALGFLLWLAAIFLLLAVRRPRLSIAEGIILISWTYFALYSARNIPLLAILTAPILAPSLSEIVRSRWQFPTHQNTLAVSTWYGWPVTAFVAVVGIALLPHKIHLPPGRWPIEAVKFVKENPTKFAGNAFNQYMWGGYLMEFLPEHKVFVDGRADFYGEGLVKEFDAVTALQTNWFQILKQHDVAWTLMPSEHRLNVALDLLPGWQRAFSDQTATIFLKQR